MKMNKLTAMILISMLVGILTGHLYRSNVTDPAAIAAFASNISILTDIFLRLIKMIIAPLVFSTLVVGIAKMGDSQTVGRVGIKAMAWFMTARPGTLVRAESSCSSMASMDSGAMTEGSSGRTPAMSSQSFSGWTKCATATVAEVGTA